MINKEARGGRQETLMGKKLLVVITVIIIPLAIALAANYTTWFGTRQRTEVTLRLEGWIAIGSEVFGDVPDLRLMLASERIENVLKVSWSVTNTGNTGIAAFETGPSIVFPENLTPIAATISQKSDLLLVKRIGKIEKNRAMIDSLGIFNAGNYMKLDIYYKNVAADKITEEFYKDWSLEAKALNLKIVKDISAAPRDKTEEDTPWGLISVLMMVYAVLALIILLSYRTPSGRRILNFVTEWPARIVEKIMGIK